MGEDGFGVLKEVGEGFSGGVFLLFLEGLF